MCYNQHLVRSICAIRDQGGAALANGDRVLAAPIIVGRDAKRIAEVERRHGIGRTTADLEAALAAREDAIVFDAGSTQMHLDQAF
jgi:predicted dehydrogenase